MLSMPAREVFVQLHIDANRINARGTLESMNKLEGWHEEDVVLLLMCATAQREAAAGGNTVRREKAYTYVFAEPSVTTQEEREEVAALERILAAGAALTDSIRNDAEIVFTAKKYGAILVTADGASKSQPGGILGNRDQLKEMGYRIMTDTEAVAFVTGAIANRDEMCRMVSRETGEALPTWVGRD